MPRYVRLTHWINAVAVIVMVMSGLRIYNAAPIWAFQIPGDLTLGGWLGGALQWHFACMWLLVGNAVVYLGANVATGRFLRQFFPLSFKQLLNDAMATLRGRLAHDKLSEYNALQKLAYLAVMVDIVVLVLSGLVIWKSVQFPLLRDVLGGYEQARVVHFAAMGFMMLYLVVHLIMVALVPKSLVLMIKGEVA